MKLPNPSQLLERIPERLRNSRAKTLGLAILFTFAAIVFSQMKMQPGFKVLAGTWTTGGTTKPLTLPFFTNEKPINASFSVDLRVEVLFEGGGLFHLRPDECLETLFIDDRPVPFPEAVKANRCNWGTGFDFDLSQYLPPGKHKMIFNLSEPGNLFGLEVKPVNAPAPFTAAVPAWILFIACLSVAFVFWMLFLEIAFELSAIEFAIAGALFYAVVRLRVEFLPFQLPASLNATAAWQNSLNSGGFWTALRNSYSGFSTLTTFIYTLSSLLPFPVSTDIKVAAYVFDFLTAAGASVCMTKLGASPLKAGFAALAVLLFPPLILNSAVAMQGDSFYVACVVWSLAFALSKNETATALVLGTAFAFKLQAIFFLPAIFALSLQNGGKKQNLPYFITPYFASIIPSFLLGRPLDSLEYLIPNHVKTLAGLSAPATWLAMWPVDRLDQIAVPAALIAIAVGTCLAWALSRKVNLNSGVALLLAFALFGVTEALLTPGLGQGAFLATEICCLILAVCWPSKLWMVLTLSATSVLAYGPLLINREIIPLSFLAVGPFCVFGWLLMRVFSERNPAIPSVQSQERSLGIRKAG